MGFLHRKTAKGKGGSIKAPTFDPYGRFKNTGDGMFGFRKDNHIIMPGVTGYEKRKLEGVKKYVEKQTQKPCTLSTELINDVYSVYVNKDVKRRPETDDNSIRHQVIDKVYDSLTKVVTEDSPLYTQILTRELAMVLQKVDDEMKEEQQKQNGDGEGDGESEGLESSTGASGAGDGSGDQEGEAEAQGDGDGEGEDGSAGNPNSSNNGASKDSGSGNRESASSKIAEDLLDKAEKDIEDAKSKADEKIKDLEDQLGKEAMKDLMNTNPEFLEEIDELKENLKKVSINKESIKKVMEKILNESMNYFSSKFKRVEESLFDCEECEDLFGLEFLHPIFRNAEIMNIGNETRLYKGKMDLYLDCSSSMNYTETFEGHSIRMIDLAKGIAMVLYRMGMIENLYFFDGSLYEINNVNEISILSFSKTGGTNFNKVVEKIKINGNNSVVITDGHDSCREYSKRAFWIGIGGTQFNSNGNDAFAQYRATGQCVAYDSDNSKFEYCK